MGAFDPPNAAAHAHHHQQQITENSKIAARRTRLEMSGAHRDHSEVWTRLRLLGSLHECRTKFQWKPGQDTKYECAARRTSMFKPALTTA